MKHFITVDNMEPIKPEPEKRPEITDELAMAAPNMMKDYARGKECESCAYEKLCADYWRVCPRYWEA